MTLDELSRNAGPGCREVTRVLDSLELRAWGRHCHTTVVWVRARLIRGKQEESAEAKSKTLKLESGGEGL